MSDEKFTELENQKEKTEKMGYDIDIIETDFEAEEELSNSTGGTSVVLNTSPVTGFIFEIARSVLIAVVVIVILLTFFFRIVNVEHPTGL